MKAPAPIDIGGVLLDPMRTIDSRMLICANSGGGKSRLIRCIVEQVLATFPVLILDREGEFSTLREHFDLVLVGPGGEVPTTVASAGALARSLIELKVSAVVDLSDLRKPEKRRFVRLFLESLLALPSSLWSPTMIVIDEAHEYAPEAGSDAESRDAVIALMDQGRKRGFGGVLATQRLSKLAKDAAGEANNLCIGRFAQDLDLARASGLLGFAGKSEWATMRDSKPGEFYAVGPAFSHSGVQRFRSGTIRTTHPSPGERHSVAPPGPSRRIAEVAAKLSAMRDTAEPPAASSRAAGPDPEVARLRAENEGLRAKIEEVRLAALKESWDRAIDDLVTGLRSARVPDVAPKIVAIKTTPTTRPVPRLPDASPSPKVAAADRVVKRPAKPGALLVGGGGMRDMLVALAQAKLRSLTDLELALTCCMSYQGGTFRKYLGQLQSAEYVVRDRGSITITPAGIDAVAEHIDRPRPNLVGLWLERVGGGAKRRMLEQVIAADVAGIWPNELGRQADFESNGGTFRKYLGELRTLGLVSSGPTPLRAPRILLDGAS